MRKRKGNGKKLGIVTVLRNRSGENPLLHLGRVERLRKKTKTGLRGGNRTGN